MDSSQALVDFAKGSHPKLSFRCGSVEALPYSVGQFDLVYCAHVLHYFKEWDRALNEIRRVLAPTGKVVITIHHPADQGYAGDEPLEVHATWYDNFEVVFYPRSIKSMRDAFEKAGLEVLKVVEMNGEEGKPPLIAAFELRKPGLFEPVNNFV
jgi:ubiquinone/menaquinone biosynthesis C-methylase UbiE